MYLFIPRIVQGKLVLVTEIMYSKLNKVNFMGIEENQISVVSVVNSTEEEFKSIMDRADTMTEVHKAELLVSIIKELATMQGIKND